MMKLKQRLSAFLAAGMFALSAVLPQSAAADGIAKRNLTLVPESEQYYGDVDGNSAVDIADAVLLARFLAEDKDAEVSTNGKIAADVNCSGMPDMEDVTMILEFIALLRPELGQVNTHIFHSVNLMEGVKADKVKGKAADDAFLSSQYNLTAGLLKEATADAAGKNMMISPLSISLALAMTANGADNETLAQMESVLGDQIGMDDLNAYYYDYVANLADEENASLKRANAIWVADDESLISVPEAFLKTNANYYGADVFSAPFDSETLDDVNNYTKEHTNGMIPKLMDAFPANTVMLLLNALAFEAKWQNTFPDWSTHNEAFTLANGEKVTVPMMQGDESYYLCDDRATGFVKMYEGKNYSFAAILPNEDISLSDYIADLDAAALQKILKSRKEENVQATVPKFSFSYGLELNNALKNMGMPLAFDEDAADFSRLDQHDNVYITQVLHKTFIELDENGTKAAAVTSVAIGGKGIIPEMKKVVLNRPFLFMILDERTGLPIFIGTVTNPAA